MTENPPVDIYRPFHYNKFKKNTSGIPTYTNKHNETKQKQTNRKVGLHFRLFLGLLRRENW